MILGIDLGTTNSAVGIWKDGGSVLIPNSLGDLLTPSAVGLADDGSLLVGMAARERQVTHPKLTATTFKRWMGSKRSTEKMERLRDRFYAGMARNGITDRMLTAPNYLTVLGMAAGA